MDESLLFLRNCWNTKVSPRELAKLIKEEKKINPEIFLKKLCEICAEETPPLYFIECGAELLIEFCEKLILTIDTANEKIIQGLQTIFINKGSAICASMPVGTKESALCALKMMEICLIGDNIEKQTESLDSLIKAPVYSVFIASGRLYCYPDFTRARTIFHQFQLKNNILNHSTYGYSYFETALFADKITKARAIFDLLNARTIIGASFFFWVPRNRLFTMVGTHNTRITYLYIVQGYLNVQSLTTAYIITNFFFRALPSVAGSHIKVGDITSTSFDGKLVSEVLSRFPSDLMKSVNFPLSNSQLIELICSFPSNLSDADYPDIIYTYPALVSNLVPHFIELSKDATSVENFCLLVRNLTNVIEDFRCLVCKQGLIYETLDALMHVIRFVVTSDAFTLLLNMYLYIIRFSWRSGAITLRDHLNSYALLQDKDLSLFLRIMIGKAKASEVTEKVTLEAVNNTYSLMDKSLAFFKMLFSLPCEQFPTAVLMVKNNPYLWPFLLVYANEVNCPYLQEILKYKFPDTKITNYLFSIYMTKYDVDRVSLVPLMSDDFDYLLLLKYEICDLNFSIFQHISFLSQSSLITLETIYKIIVSWRAWVSKFGIVNFTLNLLETMNFEMNKIIDTNVVIETYESVAYLILCASENDDEHLMELIDKIMSIVFESSNEKIEGCFGLAHFCIVILLGMNDYYEECFLKVMKSCRAALTEKWDSVSPPMIFAITIVKLALYIPLFQPLISPDLFRVLIKKNDWKAAIDFFIAMGLSNRSGSPESPDFVL